MQEANEHSLKMIISVLGKMKENFVCMEKWE